MKEDVSNSMVMVQPYLYSYSFSGPPEVLISLINLKTTKAILVVLRHFT